MVWLRDPSFSYPMFEQIRDRGHMLRGVFAWEPRMLHAAWTSEPEPTSMLLVTGAFHDTLGLRPAAGRLLNQADVGNTAAEAQAVAVLSYPAWQRRFSGDHAAIGRTLRIEGQPFTIVGVTPPGFFGVAVGMSPDVTIPVTMLPRLRSDERNALVNADSFWLNIRGRVRSGMSIAQADAAFQPVWAQALAATASPDWRASWRARYLTFTSGLEPGAAGYSPVRRQFQAALWLLFGLVALVLVVACATVANLLLAAAAGRRRELALRLAIGAGRARLVKSGEPDFGIGSCGRADRALSEQPLFTDRLAAFERAEHRLAGRRHVTLRELAGYPLILTGKGSSVRQLLDRVLERERLRVRMLSDPFWDLVEPFLPIPPRRPKRGRPRVSELLARMRSMSQAGWLERAQPRFGRRGEKLNREERDGY